MSQGVRLDRRPRPPTTTFPAQMRTAPSPNSAPRAYSAVVRSLAAAGVVLAPASMDTLNTSMDITV
jgi:hypothetical protein